MARYIKANRKVAEYLHLENDRNTVKDGNYLLWQGDMLAFGPLTQLQETLTQIGGIALLPHEAREEQDGTVLRPLPTPTDERFIIEDGAEPSEETPADEPAPASVSVEPTNDDQGDEEPQAESEEITESQGDEEPQAEESETPNEE